VSLHPELTKLVNNFHKLREHVTDGSLSPEEANGSLYAYSCIDGDGFEWRIDPSGYFTRARPGGAEPAACDPSLFKAPQLPPMRGEAAADGPFPYPVKAGESQDESARRWAEIRRAHRVEEEHSGIGSRVIAAISMLGGKVGGSAVLLSLRSLDRAEGWLGDRWSKVAFWAVVTGVCVAYMITYKR